MSHVAHVSLTKIAASSQPFHWEIKKTDLLNNVIPHAENDFQVNQSIYLSYISPAKLCGHWPLHVGVVSPAYIAASRDHTLKVLKV